MIAIVHARSSGRDHLFLAATVGILLGAVELAQDCPDCCSQYAPALSLASCATLRYLLRQVAAPSLVCDGQWLAYRSWLLGAMVDLDELAEVHAREEESGAVAEISLHTRQRELYRLELDRWRDEDVRNLLTALLAAHPQTRMDSPTWLWLKHIHAT